MTNLNFYSFALKIESPSSTISLPIKMSSVSRMRIKSVRYNTASTGNVFMLIDIKGFNNNSVYFDGISVIPYTKFLILPPSINTPLIFDNPYNTSFDVIMQDPYTNFASFFMNISINNDNATSNDISPSNPLYIEIYVEGEENANKELSKIIYE